MPNLQFCTTIIESGLKRCHCERSEAIHLVFYLDLTDSFVTSFLAITFWSGLIIVINHKTNSEQI
jgi:hypothetical protein